ncbi:MAG: lysophospholipid acyltransferase family protein, partial [Fusobacteriaceae bacterium]
TKIIFTEKYDENKNFIMTCWHNKLLMGLLGTKFIKKRATLVSPSKDGELIAVPMSRYGMNVVRGSTDKEAVRSLIKLIKMAKDGYTIGTPVDGPKGPALEVKQGMIYLAQKSGVAFLPLGIAYEKKWIFRKTWDKFQLPKPFSRVRVLYGKPYMISENANLYDECEKLKSILNELDLKAEELFKNE